MIKNNNNNNNNNNNSNKIVIIVIKIWINSLSDEKKSGKNTGREKSWKNSLGKNLVTCKKFSHFSPTFFSPIR